MKKIFLALGVSLLCMHQQANAQFRISSITFVSGSNFYVNAPIGTAASNVIIGNNTGAAGTNNTFIGQGIAPTNTASGNNNVFIGQSAAALNTTGNGNTFVGQNTGPVNTTGWANTFIGAYTAGANTTGTANTFVGQYCGMANTTGGSNVFMGQGTGNANTIATDNTFLGRNSGPGNDTGSRNTFIGSNAGVNSVNGMENTFLGMASGLTNTSGSRNIAVGALSGYGAGNLQNAIVIGHNAKVNVSNAMVLGGTDATGNAVRVGIGTASPAANLHMESTGQEEVRVFTQSNNTKSFLDLKAGASPNDLIANMHGPTFPGNVLNAAGAAPAIPYANLAFIEARRAPLMLGITPSLQETTNEQNIHFINNIRNPVTSALVPSECMRINKTNGFVGIHTRTAVTAGATGAPQALFHVNLTNPVQPGLNTLVNGIRFEGLPAAMHPDVIVIDANGNLATRPYPTGGGGGTAWLLGGNSIAATPATYIGTNDAFDFNFRTNGLHRGRITVDGNWDFGIGNTFTGSSIAGIFGENNTISNSKDAFSTGMVNNITNGSDYSQALGQDNKIDASTQAFAAGSGNAILGANGPGCIAMGMKNTITNSNQSVAAGEAHSMNNGHGCFIGGGHNTTTGAYNIALGGRVTTTGTDVHAYGRNITNDLNFSIVMGFNERDMIISQRGVAVKMFPTSASTYTPNRNFEVDAAPTTGAPSNVALHNLPPTTVPLPHVVIDPGTGDLFMQTATATSSRPAGNPVIADERLAREAVPLSNAMELLDKLQPKTYRMDGSAHPGLNLDGDKKTYGILAQDLEKVMPALVAEQEQVRTSDYTELIPVLVQALKEQQAQIKAQQGKIEELMALADRTATNRSDISLSDKDVPVLEQNAPNPGDQLTSIGYYIPAAARTAQIRFSDMEGKVIRTVSLSIRGKGSLDITLSELSQGVYAYSLIVDGQLIATRKMMVNH